MVATIPALCVLALSCNSGEDSVDRQAIAPPSPKSWSLNVGGAGADTVDAMTTDPAGNVVIAGLFGDDLPLGDTTYATKGSKDAYIAKLTSAGSLLWATAFGSDSSDEVTSMIVDRSGNIYVAGAYIGSMDLTEIGGAALTAAGGSDIFVVKLNTDGVVQWALSFGGSGLDGGGRLALGADGRILLAAQYSDVITVGANELTSAGRTDIFLTRILPDGTVGNGSGLGSDESEAVAGVLSLSRTSTLIGGTYGGSLSLPSSSLTSNGKEDAFMLKF